MLFCKLTTLTTLFCRFLTSYNSISLSYYQQTTFECKTEILVQKNKRVGKDFTHSKMIVYMHQLLQIKAKNVMIK